MATKTILKDAKTPLLFLAASIPKTTPPNPQLIQTIQPSNQQPLLHLSGLRQYLYRQPPSPKVDGLGLGGALDSSFGRLQSRGSDNKEEDGSSAEWSDDCEDVCDEEIMDSEENDSSVESSDDEDDGDGDGDGDSEGLSSDEECALYMAGSGFM